MSDAASLVAYLELQGSAEMVTKSELIAAIRDRGQSISSRNLSYYATTGLIPPAVRVGSRGGVYPAIVVDQLSWVINARAAELSIDAIRELLPLWRLLVRGRRDRRIDLAEVEIVARQHDMSLEANYRVPFLFNEVLSCICADCLSEIEWILKDGSTFHHTDGTPLTLSFILGKLNEDTGEGEVVAWAQMALPLAEMPNLDGPTTIRLGVPMNVPIVFRAERQHLPRRRSNESQREVLPLG